MMGHAYEPTNHIYHFYLRGVYQHTVTCTAEECPSVKHLLAFAKGCDVVDIRFVLSQQMSHLEKVEWNQN